MAEKTANKMADNGKMKARKKSKNKSINIVMQKDWYGKPLEEVDPLVFHDTFCVISKKSGKNYIYRFSSTKSLFLFAPLNPIRRKAIYLTTHRVFDVLIALTTILNSITLAMVTNHWDSETNKLVKPGYQFVIDCLEFAFLGIYSLEVILKVIAKGALFHKFSYLRNRWNILDLVVVVSGYICIVIDMLEDFEHVQLDFLKTFRVLRVLKIASIMPALKLMIDALISSVRGLMGVMSMTLVFLSIFSLFAQELFLGQLKQKCVIDKGGVADPNRLINKAIADELEEDRDRLWTEWVSNEANWKIRSFPARVPFQCGNQTTARHCGKGYTCLGQIGDNPDDGWTNFDAFFSAMLSVWQVTTTDHWEHLYGIVYSTTGIWSLIFFVPVIFLGAYYLVNLMLAVVAVNYGKETKAYQRVALLPFDKRLKLNRNESNFSFDDLSHLKINRMLESKPRPAKRNQTEPENQVRSGIEVLPFQLWKTHKQTPTPSNHNDNDTTVKPKAKIAESERMTKVVPPHEDLSSKPSVQNMTENDDFDLDSESSVFQPPGRWERLSKYFIPVVEHPCFEVVINLCIILNTLILAMEHHGASTTLELICIISSRIFMVVFTLEFILKLLALRREYFRNGWNVFDLIIVLVSYLDMVLVNQENSRGLSVLRNMRLLLVFKLAESWITMKVLLNIILSSLGALGHLTCVLFLIIYIFAVMGMQIIGGQYDPAAFDAIEHPLKYPTMHWRHFWYAVMSVFRVLCGKWIEPLWDCLKAQTHYASTHSDIQASYGYAKCIGFYVSVTIVGQFVVLNLFLALLLESFDTEEMQKERKKELAVRGKWNIGNIVSMLIKLAEEKEEKDEKDEVSLVEPEPNGEELTEKEREIVREKEVLANWPHRRHRPSLIRFKRIVNKVIHHNRIKKAIRAITRRENHLKRRMKLMPPSISLTLPCLLLSNPGRKVRKLEYDSESSKSSKLSAPGDCIPSRAWISRLQCWDRVSVRYRNFRCIGSYHWQSFRECCVAIVGHNMFEYFILALIFASSITLCFEDIHLDEKPKLKKTLCMMNQIFTVVFLVEVFLKIMAIGLWGYFTSFWTFLDAFIVSISVFTMDFSMSLSTCTTSTTAIGKTGLAANLGAIKVLRTLRALRPLQAISRWEGMKIVVNALINSIPSIFNVLLVCLVFWLIFAIMGVQFFKGQFYQCVDEDGIRLSAVAVPDKTLCCARSDTHGYSWINTFSNFDNVFEGYLSLLQIATFEGWMEIMLSSVDAVGVDKQPKRDNQIEFYAFFVAFCIFGSFFTLQLFIGVIIDNFNSLKKKYESIMLELMLTPGQRNYYIAMKNLLKKRPQQTPRRPETPFMKFFYDLAMCKKLEVGIFLMIFFNMLLECFEHYGEGLLIRHITHAINAFFTIVYALEAMIKIVGLGTFYFTLPWNVYDFILMVASLCDVYIIPIAITFPVPPTMLRVVRILRIGRLLRHIKAAQGIRKLLFALVISLPALVNIGALLALITFIYATLGMAMFGGGPKKWSIDEVFNFDTFLGSNLILLRLMTAAGWNEILYSMTKLEPVCGTFRHLECGKEGEPECPRRGVVVFYIVSYLVLTHFIVINLYIAIIMDNYWEATNEQEVGIFDDDFEMFHNRWTLFDPDATQFINVSDLSELLDSLELPLRIAKPNYISIAVLNLPLARGDKVHFLDVLKALVRHAIWPEKDTKEFNKIHGLIEHKFHKQFPSRTLLDIVSSTSQWARENHAAGRIQHAWREHRSRLGHDHHTVVSSLTSTKGL